MMLIYGYNSWENFCDAKVNLHVLNSAAPTVSTVWCFFTLATVPSFYHLYYKVSSFSAMAMEVRCTEKGKRAIILRSAVAFLQHSSSQFCSENHPGEMWISVEAKKCLCTAHQPFTIKTNVYPPLIYFCEIIKLRIIKIIIKKNYVNHSNHIALRMSEKRWFYQI